MLGLSDAQWISIAVVSGFVGVIVQMQAWERRLAKQLFALLDRERFQEQARLEREWTQSQKEIKRARRAAFWSFFEDKEPQPKAKPDPPGQGR